MHHRRLTRLSTVRLSRFCAGPVRYVLDLMDLELVAAALGALAAAFATLVRLIYTARAEQANFHLELDTVRGLYGSELRTHKLAEALRHEAVALAESSEPYWSLAEPYAEVAEEPPVLRHSAPSNPPISLDTFVALKRAQDAHGEATVLRALRQLAERSDSDVVD